MLHFKVNVTSTKRKISLKFMSVLYLLQNDKVNLTICSKFSERTFFVFRS